MRERCFARAILTLPHTAPHSIRPVGANQPCNDRRQWLLREHQPRTLISYGTLDQSLVRTRSNGGEASAGALQAATMARVDGALSHRVRNAPPASIS